MKHLQRGFIVGALYLALGTGIFGAVSGACGMRLYYLHKIDVMAADARAAADKASEENRLASHAYELQRAKRVKKVVKVARHVEKLLEANREWSAAEVPAEVRKELDSAAVDGADTGP